MRPIIGHLRSKRKISPMLTEQTSFILSWIVWNLPTSIIPPGEAIFGSPHLKNQPHLLELVTAQSSPMAILLLVRGVA